MEERRDRFYPPRLYKRDRHLQLNRRVPYRIYCTRVCPILAPNGSSIVFHGQEQGLSILWLGGRRLQTKRASDMTETRNGQEVVMIDDSDDNLDADTQQQPDYEDQEDEIDPDWPFPGIVQNLTIDLDVQVFHVCIPQEAGGRSVQTLELSRTHVPVVIGDANGTIQVLSIPLAPPPGEKKDQVIRDILKKSIRLQGVRGVQQDVTAKIRILREKDEIATTNRSEGSSLDGELLVASVSSTLTIWQLMLSKDGIRSSKRSPIHQINLSSQSTNSSFNPAPLSTQLLITDSAGAVRIYDPFAPNLVTKRPPSRDSTSSGTEDGIGEGRWIMVFHAPFEASGGGAQTSLARRKKILDAVWIVNGRNILVLLHDGEWIVWDMFAKQPGKGLEDIVLRGFLSNTRPHESGPESQKRGSSRLAPMTPNTRKAKAENLFRRPARLSEAPVQGKISIAHSTMRSGQVDESVAIWYGSDIFSILSTHAFIQRSSSGGSLDSLYAPAFSHLSDVELGNEKITSLDQFNSRSTASSSEQMNTQRELLISTEYRWMLVKSLRSQISTRQLFPQPMSERPNSRDQFLLNAGELDLGGMDRMLETMAREGGRSRKVGFTT